MTGTSNLNSINNQRQFLEDFRVELTEWAPPVSVAFLVVLIFLTAMIQYRIGYMGSQYVATRDNLTAVGSAIMEYKATENEFLNALVNKVALTIVRSKTFKNPLAVLKKGTVPFGTNIEEIYTNPTIGGVYNPSGSELFTPTTPDTKVLYHTRNRQGKHTATIYKSQLMGAFKSYEALEKLLNDIVNSIYSGDNIEEFMLMKELFGSCITGEKLKTCEVARITNDETAKAFVKAVKTIGQGMAFPSTQYNTYADINKGETPANTWTPIENQVLLLRNDVSVEVDVELLAKAFNVSYTDLQQRTIIVDNFGSASNCGAVLCDEAFVQVYDNLYQLEDVRNGDGLFTKYILHHWQTYSASIFSNAMAFVFPET